MRAPDPWIVDEPRLWSVAAAVFARAARRPLLVLGLTLLATVTLVAQRVRRAPSYVATLYFQMLEGEVQELENAPRPPSNVREYIGDVVLNRRQLVEIMEKYGLARTLFKRNPDAAIESMRDDIEIDVQRNYFIWDRRPGDEPRTADVMIAYHTGDPDRARAVAHELGDAVLRAQATARRERLRLGRQLVDVQLERARGELERLQGERDLLLIQGGPDRIAARAKSAAVEQQVKVAVSHVQKLEKRSAELGFAQRVESEDLGLTFELIDEGLEVSGAPLSTLGLIRLALTTFLLVLVIVAGVVGVFDDRIYRPSDLAERGWPVLGALVRFSGDDLGAYRARTRRRWTKGV
jgi:hypothetical protein